MRERWNPTMLGMLLLTKPINNPEINRPLLVNNGRLSKQPPPGLPGPV